MKFIIPAFALIAVSAVYANGADDIRVAFPYKAALNTSNDSSSRNVSDECKIQFQPYLECFEDANSVNIERYCSTYSSEKCEKVYNDPEGVLTECKDSPYIMELVAEYIDKNLQAYKFACTKDESGNSCPFSKLALSIITTMTQKEYQDMKLDTCSSKICKEATYDIICAKTDSVLTITDKKGLCEYLTTCEDKSNANANANSDESGALSLKIGSGLLITLGLLLLSIY